ncbi:MAG: 3-deoxy-8-phosphooctulonate synthase [Planctomycetota bacterium]
MISPITPGTCRVGSGDRAVEIGADSPLCLIGGPCTLESMELGLEIGTTLRDACRAVGIAYVFKASFDKANRSSVASARGPGLELGLGWLSEIGERLGVPVTTDLHEPAQAGLVAESVDLLQIPAFLCRQTDLLIAAGEAAESRGRGVSVKKGQFLSPREMGGPVRKLQESGCANLMLIERGTFFGYHRLVNDFVGLGDLMELDCRAFGRETSPPVCFDVTHSTQLPGSGEQTGGRPERGPLLARAAVAAGVPAVFIEAHPEPSSAVSDAATQMPLGDVPKLLGELASIRGAIAG